MRYIYNKDIVYWERHYADFSDHEHKITRLNDGNYLIENERGERYALCIATMLAIVPGGWV